METNVLRDGQLFTVNGKPALMLASNDEVFTGLMFRRQDAKLQMATFRRKRFADISPLDNCGTGMLGLFRATMLWNKTHLDLSLVAIDDITQGKDEGAWLLVAEAIELRRPLFAARVAAGLPKGPYVELIMSVTQCVAPTLVRVALLPHVDDPDVVRTVIDAAHSRHWKETYAGDDWDKERYATAAAYVFAEHHGLDVDDHEGKQSIRSGLFVQTLVRNRHIPWVATMVHPHEV